MSIITKASLVDKLLLLEQKTGLSVRYEIMSPISEPCHDPIVIQQLAKAIAEFAGLAGLTFIVAITKQKQNVGGHVDLSTEDQEVFVEIDPALTKYPEAVVATLCHEVCHKWLQLQGIRSPVVLDNEILTDVTSVFLGFGKIMLNGCKVTHVDHNPLHNGSQKVTEEMTTGYLDREELAFVYRVACAMRRISLQEFMAGLNNEARTAVRACDMSWGDTYSQIHHDEEHIHNAFDRLKKDICATQGTMADLHKHLSYTKKSFIETVDSFLGSSSKELESFRQRAANIASTQEADPALRFLRAMKADGDFTHLRSSTTSVLAEAESFLRHTRQVTRHLLLHEDHFPAPASAMFNVVSCPQDGTKLRLPENSGPLIVKCPQCNYRFPYNTNPALTFADLPPPKASWWQRARDRVRGRRRT